jgi:hypothetical protein
MTITALDPADSRALEAKVAGPAALFVAKAHKIHDRLKSDRVDRLDDKDAADVIRLMQTTRPAEVSETFRWLGNDPVANVPSAQALSYLDDCSGEEDDLALRWRRGPCVPQCLQSVSQHSARHT